MKIISKLAFVAAFLPIVAVSSPAIADSPGQLEGGTGIFLSRNVTQNGSYSDSTSASACDVVKYSTRLHNTAFGGLTDVQVKVNLPSASAASNTATMTATTNLGGTSGTSDTTTVSFGSAQTLSYVSGTTVLYDGNSNVIRTLPDTITTSGVDIGALNGSTTEFVNFEAKANCSTPPSPQPQPQPQPSAKALPNTGAGDVIGIFTGASSLGAAGHFLVNRRRR